MPISTNLYLKEKETYETWLRRDDKKIQEARKELDRWILAKERHQIRLKLLEKEYHG